MISKHHELQVQNATICGILTFKKPSTPQTIGIVDQSLEYTPLAHAGIPGDHHFGKLRKVKSFQSRSIPPDSLIVNERQVYIGIAQEFIKIAEEANLTEILLNEFDNKGPLNNLTPSNFNYIKGLSNESIIARIIQIALGCNLLIDDPNNQLRIRMSNGSMLSIIPQEPNFKTSPTTGEPVAIPPTTLMISSYNTPCQRPVNRIKEIVSRGIWQGSPELEADFIKAITDKHGWLGLVAVEGKINIGDSIVINTAPSTPRL
jgi:hypothetical protein